MRPGKRSVIGNGVVVDPVSLLSEIKTIREQGVAVSPDNLVVSESVSLILPVHIRIDKVREAAATGTKIGTTGRGIGPAYEDKVARRGIRLSDLRDEAHLRDRLNSLATHHNVWLSAAGEEPVSADQMADELLAMANELLAYAGQSWRVLAEAQSQHNLVLFEGAQGIMLDIDHGTYPFVTSSNTVAGQAGTGAGTGPNSVGYVLGITKAYTTRVGSGPFPTEDFAEDGERMGQGAGVWHRHWAQTSLWLV